MQKRRIPKRHPITQEFLDILLSVPSGTTIRYVELSRLFGRPITRQDHHLSSAIEIARKAYSLHFKGIPNEGLRRLNAEQQVARDRDVTNKHRRLTRRERQRANVAAHEYAALSYEKKCRLNGRITKLTAGSALWGNATDRQIQRAVDCNRGRPISIDRAVIVNAFSNPKKGSVKRSPPADRAPKAAPTPATNQPPSRNWLSRLADSMRQSRTAPSVEVEVDVDVRVNSKKIA